MTDEFYQVITDRVQVDEPAPLELPEPTFWGRVRANLGLMSREQQRQQLMNRLQALNDAIETHPEALANYVLRGETSLELGLYDAAVSDFEHVIAAAQQAIAENTWGIIAQAAMERAYRGLHQAGRSMAGQQHKYFR